MEDVAVDREISACWVRLSNKENGNCIEPEENASDLQTSSSSLTNIASTDTRATQEQPKSVRESPTLGGVSKGFSLV